MSALNEQVKKELHEATAFKQPKVKLWQTVLLISSDIIGKFDVPVLYTFQSMIRLSVSLSLRSAQPRCHLHTNEQTKNLQSSSVGVELKKVQVLFV